MADINLKHTPLFPLHVEHGAKMGAFAGYSMPLFYPLGLVKEHLHTRSRAGLFDISHMVHIEVVGNEAADLISRLCPIIPAEQEIGTCKYTFFLNEEAGIIDDLIVTKLEETRFLIVANAGCAEKDIAHVNAIAKAFDCSITIVPRGFIAAQGPTAEATLMSFGLNVADMAFMTAKETEDGKFISRTGYTGEDGFEIALPEAETASFAQALLENSDVELIGLGARDSLRLEAGLSLYGQDLDKRTTPAEAGRILAIPKPLREGGSFIGANALTSKLATGRQRQRIGLKPKQKIPVRAGATLLNANGDTIGVVTSGGFGPSIDYPVALGMVETAASKGTIFAEVRGKQIEMETAKIPFVPHNYKR